MSLIEQSEGDASSTPGTRYVSMSNALTRAGHGLTLGEKRVIASAVSRLDSKAPRPPGLAAPVVKITAAEYAETFDLDASTAYQQLQSATKNLYERSIVIFEPAYKRGARKIEDKGVITKMRWVGKVKYHEGEGWVELAFWQDVVPHLMGLQKQFTTYQLQQASALRSVYSWRLLELLMRFKDTGWAEYTIEDFCQSMDATEKMKADFASIRRKVIEPAIKELAEKDGWSIEWQPIKAGRKVKGLRFTFARNKQAKLDI